MQNRLRWLTVLSWIVAVSILYFIGAGIVFIVEVLK